MLHHWPIMLHWDTHSLQALHCLWSTAKVYIVLLLIYLDVSNDHFYLTPMLSNSLHWRLHYNFAPADWWAPAGHILRLLGHRLAKHVMNWVPSNGGRRRGRPRNALSGRTSKTWTCHGILHRPLHWTELHGRLGAWCAEMRRRTWVWVWVTGQKVYKMCCHTSHTVAETTSICVVWMRKEMEVRLSWYLQLKVWFLRKYRQVKNRFKMFQSMTI